jgi:hypothetical protein
MTTIGRWSPNKVRSKIIDAQWVSETRYALELVKPSSVVVTGGSASATVSALGSVEFTSCETLSLNGVFQSGYDNYMISMWNTASTNQRFEIRLRASGSDASGSDYVRQFLLAESTTVSGARATLTSFNYQLMDTDTNGWTFFFYGPGLAQPTAMRTVSVSDRGSAAIFDSASTHSLSTAYDGLSFIAISSNISGRVAVYGMRG